jgi:hypothetical protein
MKNELRKKDTVGNLLWFHLHRSTEYISKYIVMKLSLPSDQHPTSEEKQSSPHLQTEEPSPSSSPSPLDPPPMSATQQQNVMSVII